MSARTFWRAAVLVLATAVLSGMGTAGAGADPLPWPIPGAAPWCC